MAAAATSLSRKKQQQQQQRVGYRCLSGGDDDDSSSGGGGSVLWLVEDNTMVLLGGEVWPSAFAMADAVETRLLLQQSSEAPPPSIIVELGAGVGLCGLVAAAAVRRRPHHQQQGPCRVYLTDESPELAALNAGLFRTEWLGSSSSSSLDVTVEVGELDRYVSCVSTHTQIPIIRSTRPRSTKQALELLWGDADLPPPLASALASPQASQHPASLSLLVLGCEVTPMAKTQPALVATLRALLLHPTTAAHAAALLTVDACTLQRDEASGSIDYPRVCPAARQGGGDGLGRQCAGHGFLTLVSAEGDLEWSVERVWTAEEARAACYARRVRDVGDGGIENVDFTAATAPEGLVLVLVSRSR